MLLLWWVKGFTWGQLDKNLLNAVTSLPILKEFKWLIFTLSKCLSFPLVAILSSSLPERRLRWWIKTLSKKKKKKCFHVRTLCLSWQCNMLGNFIAYGFIFVLLITCYLALADLITCCDTSFTGLVLEKQNCVTSKKIRCIRTCDDWHIEKVLLSLSLSWWQQ